MGTDEEMGPRGTVSRTVDCNDESGIKTKVRQSWWGDAGKAQPAGMLANSGDSLLAFVIR